MTAEYSPGEKVEWLDSSTNKRHVGIIISYFVTRYGIMYIIDFDPDPVPVLETSIIRKVGKDTNVVSDYDRAMRGI